MSQIAAAVLTALALFWAAAPAAWAAGQSGSGNRTDNPEQVLILPFDMVDTSLQGDMNHGPLKADVARLRRTQEIVADKVDALAPFEVMSVPDDVKPKIKEALDTYRYLYRCNGCELEIGRRAGADLVMTGWVQKVSNLILNFNISLKDVATGNEVAGGSVDMRGNTDDSWRHAAIYFVKHNLIDTYRQRRQSAQHASDAD